MLIFKLILVMAFALPVLTAVGIVALRPTKHSRCVAGAPRPPRQDMKTALRHILAPWVHFAKTSAMLGRLAQYDAAFLFVCILDPASCRPVFVEMIL